MKLDDSQGNLSNAQQIKTVFWQPKIFQNTYIQNDQIQNKMTKYQKHSQYETLFNQQSSISRFKKVQKINKTESSVKDKLIHQQIFIPIRANRPNKQLNHNRYLIDSKSRSRNVSSTIDRYEFKIQKININQSKINVDQSSADQFWRFLKQKKREFNNKSLQQRQKRLILIENNKYPFLSKRESSIRLVNSRLINTQSERSHQKKSNIFDLRTQFSKKNTKNGQNGQITENKCMQDNRKNQKNLIPQIPSNVEIDSFIINYTPLNEIVDIKKLKNSNFFRVKYSPYQIYFGEMVKRTKSGIGVWITKQFCFEGFFKSNQRSKGVQISKKGIYKGQYLNDMKEGYGQLQQFDGQYYIGQWRQNMREGDGLWVNGKGDSYNGGWRNGKKSGNGSMTTSKSKYRGDFLQSKKHGWGKQIFCNGDVFEGIYKNGLPNGKGLYRWQNESFYNGQFLDGLRHGLGILKNSHGFEYEGEFKNDRMQGQCQIIMPNEDRYEGYFKNGQKNGRGVLLISKQKVVLDGFWRNDFFIKQIYT